MCDKHPLWCRYDDHEDVGRDTGACADIPAEARRLGRRRPRRRLLAWDEPERAVDLIARSLGDGRPPTNGRPPPQCTTAAPRHAAGTEQIVTSTLARLDVYLSGAAGALPGRHDPYGVAPYVRRRLRPFEAEVPDEYWRTIGA